VLHVVHFTIESLFLQKQMKFNHLKVMYVNDMKYLDLITSDIVMEHCFVSVYGEKVYSDGPIRL
jgi:hypothetical protein